MLQLRTHCLRQKSSGGMPCLQPPASLFYGKSTKLLKFALAQDKKKRHKPPRNNLSRTARSIGGGCRTVYLDAFQFVRALASARMGRFAVAQHNARALGFDDRLCRRHLHRNGNQMASRRLEEDKASLAAQSDFCASARQFAVQTQPFRLRQHISY